MVGRASAGEIRGSHPCTNHTNRFDEMATDHEQQQQQRDGEMPADIDRHFPFFLDLSADFDDGSMDGFDSAEELVDFEINREVRPYSAVGSVPVATTLMVAKKCSASANFRSG